LGTTATEQAEAEDPANNKPTAPDFGAMLRDRAFQAEFDSRVSKALATARAHWEREAQERIDKARAEGEKLAKMTAEERAQAEQKSWADDFERQEAVLRERETDIVRRELMAQAKETLAEASLPLRLAKVLDHVVPTADAFNACLTAIEEAHREGVREGIIARLRPMELPKDTHWQSPAPEAAMRAAAGLKTTNGI